MIAVNKTFFFSKVSARTEEKRRPGMKFLRFIAVRSLPEYHPIESLLKTLIMLKFKFKTINYIIYANVTGWSAITEIIARGQAEDNYFGFWKV